MLEMKSHCELCKGELSNPGEVYICSYECTYCVDCCTALGAVCPNCGGELVRRPSRPEKAGPKTDGGAAS